jgi:hypothetical protein
MLLLQLRQFLFSPGKLRLGCRSVLLCRHVVQHYDIPLLQMEPIQMFQCILSLQLKKGLSRVA